MPRTGYAGNQTVISATGGTPDTQLISAEIPSTARLLDVAAVGYGYDNDTGQGKRLWVASGVAAGASGDRFYPFANRVYNGSNYDPELTNTTATLLTLAARTGDTASAVQTNKQHRGVLLTLSPTAKVAATTLTFVLRYYDLVSGSNAQQIAVSPAFAAAVGTLYGMLVAPGVVAADISTPNNAHGLWLPYSWDLLVVHGDASSITYSVGAQLLKGA